MTETKDKKAEDGKEKKTLSLGGKGTLSLKTSGGGAGSTARQSGAGASRSSRGGPAVAVEIRRRRTGHTSEPAKDTSASTSETSISQEELDKSNLTSEEREARARALLQAEEYTKQKQQERAELEERAKQRQAEKAASESAKETEGNQKSLREQELEELRKIEEEERLLKQQQETQTAETAKTRTFTKPGHRDDFLDADEREEESYREKMKRQVPRRPKSTDNRRNTGKLTVTQALNKDFERDRGPSLAAQRRAREKARMAEQGSKEPPKKQVREIIVPEVITVQDLANRMAERSGDVIKALMKMGVMATINQSLDADTAELIIDEFGHKIKRVTEADVEIGLEGEEDKAGDLKPRPPVVTVMGHVDHGKTSLLDAMRATDVVSGEAGGITQHIGAYQITMESGQKITFLDTPGHAAFTEMRARGANVTDIVVLVVAANDSLMPQTIEAINHAKAANVPLVVAINKIDLPDADPQKVKNDLLQHEVVIEDMGGETQCVEISAKKRINLDKLEEAILLQAEILELKANPDREAVGTVVEAKMEQGRGHVATVLIQNGTLRIGDVFVIGSEYGKVRAMIDDHGQPIEQAIPGQPVEVLGLNGGPQSGDVLIAVEDEARAREISDYRHRKRRLATGAVSAPGSKTFEQLIEQQREGEKKSLAIVIKGDVHGSVEAIAGSLEKLAEDNDEVNINILHMGAGGITESDVILAKASGALIVGFNVRANVQARELAEKEGIDIRYYNIIYNVIDDAKAILSGMLSPIVRENYLGQAEIRQVFKVSKVGNIAGCMVTKGTVKRGAHVRLLRDDVVIHEGTLKTLKRFKDEVKDVKEGMECGMAFENYDDIKERDIIECYELVEEARELE